MKANKVYIYGKHAVFEALQNKPHVIEKIFRAYSTEDKKLDAEIARSNIPVKEISGNEDIERGASHQGVFALIAPEKLLIPYKEFIQTADITQDTAYTLLDELQDPHNVGAIIRSAAGFGISAVLIPEHNQAPLTGAVVKVSAGMAFRVPLVLVTNVNATLRDLKEKGFWIYGLTGEGNNSLTKETFDAPSVFVLGNEGKGMREKTEELCDIKLSIPIHPQCESLNVAASAAVTFYAWSTQHPEASV
jgi:23S rRNA (guanosine2251-2'-O)-methyltransferase